MATSRWQNSRTEITGLTGSHRDTEQRRLNGHEVRRASRSDAARADRSRKANTGGPRRCSFFSIDPFAPVRLLRRRPVEPYRLLRSTSVALLLRVMPFAP